jgi:hypothetical protein
VPCRNVTVTAFPCREDTDNVVAVQAKGTQAITEGSSVRLEFGVFTE